MRTGMLQSPVLAIGILVLAGCQHSQSAGTKIAPLPPAQPFVFYDRTGDASERTPALSEVELRDIIGWVATQTSDPIWLIWVKSSPHVGERGWIFAYLVPDETTPRVRTGLFYDIPEPNDRTRAHPPFGYAQVSASNHIFTKRFMKPAIRELPFYWQRRPRATDPISREELIAIVDIVRQPSSYEGLADPGKMSHSEKVRTILESPVNWIWRKDAEINVEFGFDDAFAGSMLSIVLEATPTGYKVTKWGEWRSWGH